MFLPQGSKRDLFKWIYKMVHKLEQIQHLHYCKTRLKGERMRNLYIVRSELFRDQHVYFLIKLAGIFIVFDDRQTRNICDWMEVGKHHAEELSGKH